MQGHEKLAKKLQNCARINSLLIRVSNLSWNFFLLSTSKEMRIFLNERWQKSMYRLATFSFLAEDSPFACTHIHRKKKKRNTQSLSDQTNDTNFFDENDRASRNRCRRRLNVTAAMEEIPRGFTAVSTGQDEYEWNRFPVRLSPSHFYICICICRTWGGRD